MSYLKIAQTHYTLAQAYRDRGDYYMRETHLEMWRMYAQRSFDIGGKR